MAMAIPDSELLRGYDCAGNGCTRRQLHIHLRSANGEILAVGTGGLPAFVIGRHVVIAQPYEVEDYGLDEAGNLVDHGVEHPAEP